MSPFKGQDFYFSASEARGEHFLVRQIRTVAEYQSHRTGALIWATEVTEPGARPVSRSRDLICVGRNVRATFLGRVTPKQGDLWGALQEA